MKASVKLFIGIIICMMSCSCREKETTVHFKATGFETGLIRGKCKDFSCSHYDGSNYFTNGHDITTGEIIIPKGQIWSYKDYSTNYSIEEKHANWITRPYILYNVNGSGKWKKCQIPDDTRSIRFYQGDKIRIGTYASANRGYYDYIDIQVAFNIEYL